MRQKFLYLISLVLIALQGWALPVDESSARAIVQDFVVQKRGLSPNSLPTSGGSDLLLLHAETSSVNVTEYAYYIFNTGDGFVIVAGDDRAESILGYGDEELDKNDIPSAMQSMLDSFKEQIDYLLEHPGLEVEVETPSLNAPRLTATSVAPLLTAKWNQGKPYYNLTPVHNGSHCITGCSCVALCQVMHYWKYPTIDVPSVPAYTTRTLDISVPELESSRFHWNYIKDSYTGSYTADEAYSVAKLMRYAGQAMEMDYTPNGSGAAVFQILNAAVMFGYDHNAKVLYKDDGDYTDAQWAALIQAELYASRPVIYAGWSASNGSLEGHAFNIDGYNASKNKYHVNWGWGGSGNGYFALNAYNVSNYHFNDMQQMIVGLKPQAPEIVVNPTSKSFSIFAGESRGEYITINGYALTGDLNVTLNNGGDIYSIEKYSITREEAVQGINLLVFYRPKEVGTSSASLTISGGGAPSKTVSLSGTAYPASTITVNPSSLSFKAATGETKTATFLVKCPNAISDLKLNLNNGGSIYSIDKTSISKSAAISGTNVTVTYKPTERGTSNASITISGGGANPKTVSLSGEATKPEITVTPSSLSFDAHFVETKTATINVKGYDLNGNLSLALNDPEGIYAIDKTSISKSEAINGTTVTVSYSPTKNGSSNASIIISGGGADPKTVNISGNASIPEITVEPDSLSFNTYVNNPVMKKITVRGSSLSGVLSLALNDSSGNFSIATTNLTPSGSSIYANVTVTYNPVVAGESVALLTVSGGGADPQTVVLTGVAKELPVVDVDVNSLSFESTYTGYQTSKTIIISSPNLSDNLQLSISRDNTHSFGLSKTTITPEAAAAGTPVTIYFGPTAAGGKHAAIDIKFDGCTVLSIPVSGYGIKSDGYITAGPSSLSFETQVGTPVTKTFLVAYSDADGGSIMISSVGGEGETNPNDDDGNEGTMQILKLAKIDLIWKKDSLRRKEFIGPLVPFSLKNLVLEVTGDDCFEITPSRISLLSVPYSTYVTVTYNPDCVGDNDAILTIKLTGGSARPLTLPLHGTATGQLNAANSNDGFVNTQDLMSMPAVTNGTSGANELEMASKVYANGKTIIIESPVEQSAVISDIAGHAMKVNLQVGHNEIPVNASGIYIVRIKEKTTKLMLK